MRNAKAFVTNAGDRRKKRSLSQRLRPPPPPPLLLPPPPLLKLPQAKPEPGSGSTDWGNVSYVVPSVETAVRSALVDAGVILDVGPRATDR